MPMRHIYEQCLLLQSALYFQVNVEGEQHFSSIIEYFPAIYELMLRLLGRQDDMRYVTKA